MDELKVKQAKIADYFKNAVASRYLFAYQSSGTVAYLDFPSIVFQCVLLHDSCKCVNLAIRSNARKVHDGLTEISDCFRVNMLGFRAVLCDLFGDDIKTPYTVETIETGFNLDFEIELFCEHFNCHIGKKWGFPDTKSYTSGDFWEYKLFEFIAGNNEKWHKNCRRYDSGTDCNCYEIKSLICGRGYPTFTPITTD